MEIGLSTCSKLINDDLFREYSENLISHMEITVDYDQYDDIDYENLRMLADKYNIKLWSYHLPFMPFSEIDMSKKQLQCRTLKYYKELIARASDIGINKFIVHPSGEPIFSRFRKNRIEYTKESFYELAEFASDLNSEILCENLPRTCLGCDSEEILEIVSVNDKLKVCFDTNHLLDEHFSDFIQKVGDRIVSIHVSDYDYLNERHWLPGEGRIDWYRLYNELIAVGYEGPWLYEVSFKAPKSIIRERDLTCEDFYKNANEIFNHSPLSVLSAHIKGLKYWK